MKPITKEDQMSRFTDAERITLLQLALEIDGDDGCLDEACKSIKAVLEDTDPVRLMCGLEAAA
jgi:hypothetical protein